MLFCLSFVQDSTTFIYINQMLPDGGTIFLSAWMLVFECAMNRARHVLGYSDLIVGSTYPHS